MTDTKHDGPRQNVVLPTGVTILTDEKGMVTMKANDLVRALRMATLDGVAMHYFAGQPVQSLLRAAEGRAIPTSPAVARWGHMPAIHLNRATVERWVSDRYPLLKFSTTVWTNRKLDLVVPTYGRLWFQVEAGQLLMRPDGHPDVPDNWKPCTVPVVAFTANQLNLLRKLYKSPSISTTHTEE